MSHNYYPETIIPESSYLPSNSSSTPNSSLSVLNVFPPSTETVLASKIKLPEAQNALSHLMSSKEAIALDEGYTKRYCADTLVSMARIKANRDTSLAWIESRTKTSLARIEKNHEYRLAKLQLKRDIDMSRRAMAGSIVQSIMQNSMPRSEVNSISISESKGRFWNNYDWKFKLEIS